MLWGIVQRHKNVDLLSIHFPAGLGRLMVHFQLERMYSDYADIATTLIHILFGLPTDCLLLTCTLSTSAAVHQFVSDFSSSRCTYPYHLTWFSRNLSVIGTISIVFRIALFLI